MATLRAGSIEARDQRDPEALPGTAGLPGWDQAGLPRLRQQAPGRLQQAPRGQTPPRARTAFGGGHAAKQTQSGSLGSLRRARLRLHKGQKWPLGR